ncbi:MAG: hypothetical protein K0U15_02705 [Proteobacteria bacterium]|nr:hypothetical protein [Pseudomonadota bacterium]
MSKKLTMALFALTAVMAPAIVPPAHAASSAEAIKMQIQEADRLRQEAARLGFEWRYTQQRIKDAEKALAAGKLDEAEALVTRAKREAELAIEQAATAETVWKIAVPK